MTIQKIASKCNVKKRDIQRKRGKKQKCRKSQNKKFTAFFAERGGFEPPEPIAQFGSLANYWFQPLTHLS